MMKDKDTGGLILQSVLAAFILSVFTYFGFLSPQECDSDKQYLWCRIHPMLWTDWVGAILFYGSGLVFGGITEWLGIQVNSPRGSSSTNLILFTTAVVGFIFMWL